MEPICPRSSGSQCEPSDLVASASAPGFSNPAVSTSITSPTTTIPTTSSASSSGSISSAAVSGSFPDTALFNSLFAAAAANYFQLQASVANSPSVRSATITSADLPAGHLGHLSEAEGTPPSLPSILPYGPAAAGVGVWKGSGARVRALSAGTLEPGHH